MRLSAGDIESRHFHFHNASFCRNDRENRCKTKQHRPYGSHSRSKLDHRIIVYLLWLKLIFLMFSPSGDWWNLFSNQQSLCLTGKEDSDKEKKNRRKKMRKIYYFFLFTEKTNEQPPKDFHFCDIEDIIEKKRRICWLETKKRDGNEGWDHNNSQWVGLSEPSFFLSLVIFWVILAMLVAPIYKEWK